MLAPGEYVPDLTEGITAVEELPKPRRERRSRNYRARRCPRCGGRAGRYPHARTPGPRRCPRCGGRAGRYASATRPLHDLADGRSGRPLDLIVTYSKHHCPQCDCYFAVALSDLACPKCHYTRRVQDLA